MSKNKGYALLWVCSLVGLILLEEALTSSGLVRSQILPPVSSIAVALYLNFFGLLGQLSVTAARWLCGLAIIILAGIPLSLAIGGFRKVKGAAFPLVILVFSVPVIIIYPLFVFWGYDDASYIIPAAIGAFPPLCLAIVSSMENINKNFLKIGRTFMQSRAHMIRKIILPAIVPDIFGGLRTALNAVLIIIVTTEMISPRSGIGAEIQNMFFRFMLPDMFAAIAAVAAFGLMINLSFSLLIKRIGVSG